MELLNKDLWRHKNFLKLWFGQTVSLFGSQVTTLALPLTAVITLKASAFELSLLVAAQYAPFVLFTLLAGVWIERHPKKVVLIVSDLGRAILITVIPLLALLGLLQIEYMIVIAFLVGSLTVFFDLAYQSYLPLLVPTNQLVSGNARLQASASVAEISGPGLAGLLVGVITAPFALLIDSFSFLVSVVSLWLITNTEPQEAQPVPASNNIWIEIKEGLKVTLGNAYLRAFVGEAATYNLFNTMVQTLFTLYAIHELGIGPQIIGLILAGGGAGALVGAIVTGWVARHWGIGRTIIGFAFLSSVMPLAIPVVSGDTWIVTIVLLISYFLTGVGITGTNVHTISIRQTITPPHMLGRVNASYRFIASGAFVIGALISGWLATWLGLRLSLLIAAVGLLAPLGWMWFSPVPKLGKTEEIESLEDIGKMQAIRSKSF